MTGDPDQGIIASRSLRERETERIVQVLFGVCAVVTVLVTIGIVFALIRDAIVFFNEISIVHYLTGTSWSPIINGEFGVLPLLSGTLIVTICSAIIALPIGLAAAIYLSEYASDRIRAILKPGLEILAGVPTIIYGYFALVYITPGLQKVLPLRTFNALSASIVVAIMIIPMVSSISEDALSAVPDSLREAGYGLGSTKFDVSTKIVVPAALSGILSSYILALSRAIGETMAVTIAAGQKPKLPYFPNIEQNLFESIQTITASMVQVIQAENAGANTPVFRSMFALGLTLFVITFTLNLVADWFQRRYQEEYQ